LFEGKLIENGYIGRRRSWLHERKQTEKRTRKDWGWVVSSSARRMEWHYLPSLGWQWQSWAEFLARLKFKELKSSGIRAAILGPFSLKWAGDDGPPDVGCEAKLSPARGQKGCQITATPAEHAGRLKEPPTKANDGLQLLRDFLSPYRFHAFQPVV